MIRPARFAGNIETAASNHFQQPSRVDSSIQEQALREFESLRNALLQVGITVNALDDTPAPHKPDAIFPNNWLSFHADGTVVLYPMMAPNRRLERRVEVLEQLNQSGYHIHNVIDLSSHETANQFLEGTGSLVLDRVHHIAYACLSPRTDIEVLGEFSQRLDYELVVFNARDTEQQSIYHTNVMMCVGSRFAVVCTAVIDAHEHEGVLHALRSTGHEIVEISYDQMLCFAGNMLELQNNRGESVVVMSKTAFDSLLPAQRLQLQLLGGQLIVSDVPTIEQQGGGSVRCMIAEVFLPR